MTILTVAVFITATAHADTTNGAATNAPSPAITNAPATRDQVKVQEARLIRHVAEGLKVVPRPTKWRNFWSETETEQREKSERMRYSFLLSSDGGKSVWIGMDNTFPVGTRGGEPPPKTTGFMGLRFKW